MTSAEELRRALWKAVHGEPVFSPSLVERGHTSPEIGDELFISAKTVGNHTRNILKKLQLSQKQELGRYALEHGIE